MDPAAVRFRFKSSVPPVHEGDPAEQEVDQLRSKSYVPVTFGHTVLRAETTTLYALAAVQTVIHERKAWEPT